jgi:hypothetical protein
VLHTVELIDWATGGPAPERLKEDWTKAARIRAVEVAV